jgi:hypothetical protein
MQEENLTRAPCLAPLRAMQVLWEGTDAAESGYARDILRESILGYSAHWHLAQFGFITNRRARQFGVANPFRAHGTPCRGSTNRPACAKTAELLRDAGQRVPDRRDVELKLLRVLCRR